MVVGNIESWEGSTSPGLPFGRVENAKRSIPKSAFYGRRASSRSWECSSLRFRRAARGAKSTPRNFLLFQVTSNSSTPSLWILRSVIGGCHRALNPLPEAKRSRDLTHASSTDAVSVCLCGSRCTSVTPLLSFRLSSSASILGFLKS